MTALALSALALLAAYLIGSIPFGLLIARWAKGVDIRTVGSGNIGATNVGRVLGFRYFVIVMVLDLLKGLIPTLAFPWIVSAITGVSSPDLPVLIALAAILGHTFPIYLAFRGGKGVATSLGVVLALDPVSSLIAALVFGLCVAITRYVSLSSILGGAGFVVSYFFRQVSGRDAETFSRFDRQHIAMSLFVIGVMTLLIIRHRANLVRIWNGTENRVNFRSGRSRASGSTPPSGKINITVFMIAAPVLLAIAALGVWVFHNAHQRAELSAGPWLLREIERQVTGEQRIERVAFSRDARYLVATCPRFNRLLIHTVDDDGQLLLPRGIDLAGRPMAIAVFEDSFAVLMRPSGDNKHLEPGWIQSFEWSGRKVGNRLMIGYYPDDLALSPDGHILYVLTSGRAEGDGDKPAPSIQLIQKRGLTQPSPSDVIGSIELDASDDPERLTLSASGHYGGVFLSKTKRVAAIDFTNPKHPTLIGVSPNTGADAPYVSYSGWNDWILMPAVTGSEAIALELPGQRAAQPQETTGNPAPVSQRADYLVCTDPNQSVLELVQSSPRLTLGKLPLRGTLNLGFTKPTALAYAPTRKLLAVSTRSGAIHVVEVGARGGREQPATQTITRGAGPEVRR